MQTSEKRTLTHFGKNEHFQEVLEKLTVGVKLNYDEKSLILGSAILFLQQYQKDRRNTSFADFSYFIILKYSTTYGDYQPLYDFSINFGFYPISKAVLENGLIEGSDIKNCLHDVQLDSFRNRNDYVETLEQYVESKRFLSDESNEIGYFAPTSYGKSSLIVDCIRELGIGPKKVAIIVPTKSLLIQTYQSVRDADLPSKLIIHDEMYDDDESFIAVFTQERALRLLNKNDLSFDALFIDEAHNIMKDDSRSILISRLLATNFSRNQKQRVVYLSPLVNDSSNLRLSAEQEISSHIVRFNVKEPEIFEWRADRDVYQYNRFSGRFYEVLVETDKWDYIKANLGEKNFIYNLRPVKIEQLAEEICQFIPPISESAEIDEIANILRREVHPQFYVIEYLKHGVVYLHGKLPDIIKEYLEYKFKTTRALRFVVANSVILEGMNLPIDALFIFNTYGLRGKELMNLIGRVNRLNTIFQPNENKLDRLLPRVHFINDREHNGENSKMENKISLLRSRAFKDDVGNPTLESFDIEKVSESKAESAKQIQENESFLTAEHESAHDEVKAYMIQSGLVEFYGDSSKAVDHFIQFQERLKEDNRDDWSDRPLMDKIEDLFIHDPKNLIDTEVRRLANPEARNYYEAHILVAQKKALNENIHSQIAYFKELAQLENSRLYFGPSYGEVPYDAEEESGYSSSLFVELAEKSDSELVNLAVVKLKMEDDFVSFKLNKFIVMLYDYELISTDEYNRYIYGTTNVKKIAFAKFGLSMAMISRLESDGQLANLEFDVYNNLKGNSRFEDFLGSIDDFYRFEITRILGTR